MKKSDSNNITNNNSKFEPPLFVRLSNSKDLFSIKKSNQPGIGLGQLNQRKKNYVFDPQQPDQLRQAPTVKSIEPNSKEGVLNISKEEVYDFKESDLINREQIGKGEFSSVEKVLHMPSQTHMALKRIESMGSNKEDRNKVFKELSFVLECYENPNVVKFYGVKFNNESAKCLICMELMDTSLEKFYKFVYDVKKEEIPEAILAQIAVATVNGLNYLKEKHSILHRDVKPSNILVNRSGEVKICDFGISGKLVNSLAATRDVGCRMYMAPERIDPSRACVKGYDVRSDIWSLGITLYELSTGKFPYPQWKNIFQQLDVVVKSDAPILKSERLTADFRDFVNTCLIKDEKERPKYRVLLQHPLIRFQVLNNINTRDYFESNIVEMLASGKITN